MLKYCILLDSHDSMNLRSPLLDHVRPPLHCHQYPPVTKKRTQDGAHERLLGMRDKVAKCCLDAERLRGRYMEECLWCCISWPIVCECRAWMTSEWIARNCSTDCGGPSLECGIVFEAGAFCKSHCDYLLQYLQSTVK